VDDDADDADDADDFTAFDDVAALGFVALDFVAFDDVVDFVDFMSCLYCSQYFLGIRPRAASSIPLSSAQSRMR
jgi:hypothetical protein